MASEHVTTSTFDPNKRLDSLPPLDLPYQLDELLAEHFTFAPKSFTRHLFNMINDAVFDSVESVEEAVQNSFPAKSSSKDSGNYPSPDEISKSINKLETLLCSATDSHFDLVELWMHRNIFAFRNRPDQLIPHFKFQHMKLWDHLFENRERIKSNDLDRVGPDWEKIKVEEEETWDKLINTKQEYLQATDDHASLLAVSKALDRKLAGLKAVSTQLDTITSGAPRVYDPDTNRTIGLSSQAEKLSSYLTRLSELRVRETELRLDKARTEDQITTEAPSWVRYEDLINELVKCKVDDLVTEIGERVGPETEVDESLVEVMNHVAGKGKATDPDTPLFHKRI